MIIIATSWSHPSFDHPLILYGTKQDSYEEALDRLSPVDDERSLIGEEMEMELDDYMDLLYEEY